ncbi:MAG: ATPase, partial [Roseibium sp.]|nr:ATPase [Roseibium sp.]
RNLLAVQARRLLTGLWVLAGLGGALSILPMTGAPVVFAFCLVILWGFARFSIADTLNRSVSAA